MENVREVMAEVENWERVGRWLGVPYSKRHEIMQQSSTEREKSLALGDYWVNTAPNASWEVLSRGLYLSGEKGALAVTKQYLQQGMCSSLLAEISVYIQHMWRAFLEHQLNRRKGKLCQENFLCVCHQKWFQVD